MVVDSTCVAVLVWLAICGLPLSMGHGNNLLVCRYNSSGWGRAPLAL